MNLSSAKNLALNLIDFLAPHCHRIEIAGSIRRRKETVKDIELVCIPKLVDLTDMFGVPLAPFERSKLDRIDLKHLGHLVKDGPRQKQIRLPSGINLDLFIVLPPAQWGYIYCIRTGPADYSRWIVTPRKLNGALPSHLRAHHGAIWPASLPPSGGNEGGPTPIPTPEELDLFTLLKIPPTLPEHRRPLW